MNIFIYTQQIYINLFQGDSLITTCTYNTMDRENITLGGFAISDEMCVNYIHYYPNTRLEVITFFTKYYNEKTNKKN